MALVAGPVADGPPELVAAAAAAATRAALTAAAVLPDTRPDDRDRPVEVAVRPGDVPDALPAADDDDVEDVRLRAPGGVAVADAALPPALAPPGGTPASPDVADAVDDVRGRVSAPQLQPSTRAAPKGAAVAPGAAIRTVTAAGLPRSSVWRLCVAGVTPEAGEPVPMAVASAACAIGAGQSSTRRPRGVDVDGLVIGLSSSPSSTPPKGSSARVCSGHSGGAAAPGNPNIAVAPGARPAAAAAADAGAKETGVGMGTGAGACSGTAPKAAMGPLRRAAVAERVLPPAAEPLRAPISGGSAGSDCDLRI